MTRTHYPNPRGYVAWVRAAKAYTAAGGTVRTYWCNPDLNASAFQREVWLALDKRINDRGNLRQTGRKFDPDYQVSMRRDCWRVRDRVTKRICVHQFETKEIRRRFAHLLSSYDD